MSPRDEAAAALAAISPDYRVYDAGQFPRGSAYREAGRFFCAIEPRHGGLVYMGQGADRGAAVHRAVKIAEGDWS